MDIKKRIEKFKNQMKTAGMVAAFGTMTLNSSAQTVTQDKKENKIETVEKSNKFSEYYSEAIENNNIENVKHLIASGKDFNTEETIHKDDGTYINHPAIFMAVLYDNLEIAEVLLQAGANPNHKLDNGKTPAFWTYSVEMLQLLEKYGADLNAKDNNGNQVLHRLSGDSSVMHSSQWNTELAEFLIEKGNSLDNLKYFDPTDPERTKFCVEKGVEFDMETAVYNAVNVGTYEDVKILLENGGGKYVNVAGPDVPGFNDTPFESAIGGMISNEECMQWAKEKKGYWANVPMEELKKSWEDDKRKAELMISYGADLNVISKMFPDEEHKKESPETYKSVTQMAIKQVQLNKMKQNQGR